MRIATFVLGSLLFQVPAHADTFWLSDPEQQKNAPEGSLPGAVHGVLIAESDEGYHVRVVGGELILPKASVFKIEKDDLSIDDIVKQEKDQAEALAAADRERQMAQAAARRERDVAALEASARRVAAAPVEASLPDETILAPQLGPRYDPVRDAVVDPWSMSQPELLRELTLAWELTRDRQYLKVMRMVRRMR